ncbi:MAG TPA: trypsin-like peptidase domain-containing protein [Acidobacteriota bacterium]|nr:trypsin-like peptidase domain-containing protein [Acidobacteriota bacterium]
MSNEPRMGLGSGNRLISILMVFLVLTLGIGIGTLITYRAGAQGPGDSQLKIQTDGKPLVGGAVLTLSQAFEEVAKRVEPAVVNINTEEVVRLPRATRRSPIPQPDNPQDPQDDPMQDFFHRFFGGQGQGQMPNQFTRHSLGSGVLVDPKGYIITNNHVVEGATKIKVNVAGGDEYPAKVISADSLSDIAVIKIEGKKEFPVAKIGDARAMKVGDWVLAIGSPFGLEQTVTAGIVSATGRVFDQQTGSFQMLFNDYLQTDAAINPGNSGGPLVNMNGEVVGINSFIQTQSRSNAGVGFAVPAHIFVNVYNQILQKGKVLRGWLGVNMNTLPFTPAMASYFGVKQGGGVLITGLNDENGKPSDTGPAARAGIKPEDVIVELGGKKIFSVQDLRLAVANTPPGSRTNVKVVRRGQEKEFDVTIAERTLESRATERGGFSFEEREEQPKPEIGFRIDTIQPRVGREIGIEGGAQVLSVNPGSLAEEAGLVGQEQGGGTGDIIVEANGKKVLSAQDLLMIVKNLKSGDAVILKFLHPVAQDNQVVWSPFYTSIIKP